LLQYKQQDQQVQVRMVDFPLFLVLLVLFMLQEDLEVLQILLEMHQQEVLVEQLHQ
jgi:hypothetical protein